jgi:hypothetical protein
VFCLMATHQSKPGQCIIPDLPREEPSQGVALTQAPGRKVGTKDGVVAPAVAAVPPSSIDLCLPTTGRTWRAEALKFSTVASKRGKKWSPGMCSGSRIAE